jgi:hypothetical protein
VDPGSLLVLESLSPENQLVPGTFESWLLSIPKTLQVPGVYGSQYSFYNSDVGYLILDKDVPYIPNVQILTI